MRCDRILHFASASAVLVLAACSSAVDSLSEPCSLTVYGTGLDESSLRVSASAENGVCGLGGWTEEAEQLMDGSWCIEVQAGVEAPVWHLFDAVRCTGGLPVDLVVDGDSEVAEYIEVINETGFELDSLLELSTSGPGEQPVQGAELIEGEHVFPSVQFHSPNRIWVPESGADWLAAGSSEYWSSEGAPPWYAPIELDPEGGPRFAVIGVDGMPGVPVCAWTLVNGLGYALRDLGILDHVEDGLGWLLPGGDTLPPGSSIEVQVPTGMWLVTWDGLEGAGHFSCSLGDGPTVHVIDQAFSVED